MRGHRAPQVEASWGGAGGCSVGGFWAHDWTSQVSADQEARAPSGPCPAGHSAGGCRGTAPRPHPAPAQWIAWAHPVPSWVLSLFFHEDLREDEVPRRAWTVGAQRAGALPASCFSSAAPNPQSAQPPFWLHGVISALTTWSAELLTLGIYGNRPRPVTWKRINRAGCGWAGSALSGTGSLT